MKSKWLTSTPVANLLECCGKSIERLANNGKLPFVLVDTGSGRSIKIFDREQVLAFKAKKEAKKAA